MRRSDRRKKKQEIQENELPWKSRGKRGFFSDGIEYHHRDTCFAVSIWSQDSHVNKLSSGGILNLICVFWRVKQLMREEQNREEICKVT